MSLGLNGPREKVKVPEKSSESPQETAYGADDLLAFPLSFAQQRLWVLDRLEERTPAYNIPMALRLRGSLSIEALNQTFSEVLRRHEVLRATFEQQADGPLQIIAPPESVVSPLTDLSHLPESDRVSQAERIAAHEGTQPFDLARGPIVRARLLKLAADDHVLLITVHHIVFDGWSQRLLLRELSEMYGQIVSSGSPSMPELPLQYTDYVVWQRKFLSGRRLDEQLKYWRERLAGAPAVLDLPIDHPRPPRQTYRGARISRTISAELIRQLEQLSRKDGTTLFMALLAAFNVLLSRYSGQDDIVVGSPIAGRNRVELESLIGLFVNTLSLRTDLSGNPSFRELLARVRETTLGAFGHQEIPFEKIVEDLKPERDLSRNPIFQVMFVLQNMPQEAEVVSDLHISPFGGAEKTSAKFDLLMTASERPDGLRLMIEYSTDLFDAVTIERMHEHFQCLLNAILINPDLGVDDLPILSASDREELLVSFNNTFRKFRTDLCLHYFFEEQAGRSPGATAAIDGSVKLSYAELNSRANQLAHYLRKLGIGTDVPVGICLKRSVDMLTAILAVLKAGGAYVPLDPAYPRHRLDCILQDSATEFMITEQELLDRLPGCREIIIVDRQRSSIAAQPAHNLSKMAEPQNLAYVLFTSGSTGRPKGVALEHHNAANFVQWAQTVFRREELAGTLFSTSVCFDLSIFEMFVPWSVGGTVILAENALQLPEIAKKHKVTLINTVPSAMTELVVGGNVPNSVVTVNLAGEPLSPSLVRDLYHKTKIRHLYNLYGPTEATTYATYTYVGPDADVTIGKPIANTQAYILDARLHPVPKGVVGELYLAGDGVARGYIGQPELTKERFLNDPFSADPTARMYRTGDLCRYRVDGTLEYVGRVDHQVKLRGFRIELGEIENVLERHEVVQQAVALVADVPGGKALVGYIVPKPGCELSSAVLRRHAEQELPSYMVPNFLIMLDQLPLTSNGKVNRQALPKPNGNERGQVTAPRDQLEQLLVEIWQRVLGVSSVSVTDNFFELGGHSMLAVRLVTEIRRETGREIPLATLFQGASVEYLARVLRNGRAPKHDIVVPVQPEGSKPPFFGIVVPGANPLGYLALARHLGNDQPIYEIQGPGPKLRGRPYTPAEFEELAAQYIAGMKKIQPDGPYYFGGMCEGSRIAFDMARLLEAQGEKVAFLAILDTWVLENSQNRFLWKIDYYSGRMKSFLRISREQKWQALRQWAQHRYGSSRPARLWPKAYWPGADFVPPKYSGKITVFKVPKQPFYYINDPLLGWQSRTTGEVELQVINSKHLWLLREPYVRELAPRLSECMARAQRAAESREEQSNFSLVKNALSVGGGGAAVVGNS
jgi:amino acid adenylation domain-containing protein